LKDGIVLFAHGSRDASWARPFEQIAAQLAEEFPVRLAYLEQMKPTLHEAIASLAHEGVRSIRVVPLFLGAGGHVKNDLPRLVSAARSAHPGVRITLEDPIGERPEIIVAIADALRR
jgi:sirohydrochlorin cobaltochelatase